MGTSHGESHRSSVGTAPPSRQRDRAPKVTNDEAGRGKDLTLVVRKERMRSLSRSDLRR